MIESEYAYDDARSIPTATAISRIASALCEALRAGQLSPDDPAVLGPVRAAVLARLAVDNPRYATFARLRDRG